jgi:hypothetical protein
VDIKLSSAFHPQTDD